MDIRLESVRIKNSKLVQTPKFKCSFMDRVIYHDKTMYPSYELCD